MSAFWKRKSGAPSIDSTTPILDSQIPSEEASFLNSHPVLTTASSSSSIPTLSTTPFSQPHSSIQATQQHSLIDLADDNNKNNLSSLSPTRPANMTTTATLADSIHLALDGANKLTMPTEADTAQLTPTSQKRRSFFNFGKKKQATDDVKASAAPTSIPPITTSAPPEMRSRSTTSSTSPVSPVRSSHFGSQRGASKITSSPRLSTSSIFERNVQDSSLLPPTSPAIPSHFQTENHIPAALDASSLAITDRNVDPDSVEIVSSTSHHHPLAHPESYSNPWAEDAGNHSGDESIGHGYASSLASADKRRLSFISFADVVQAENEQASHSTTNLDTYSQKQPTASIRSSSPVRTPPNTIPPHSPPGTGLGLSDFSMEKDMSIPPKQASLATGHSHSDVTVETMSQALRRHGSTDLKAAMKGQHGYSGSEHEANPWKE